MIDNRKGNLIYSMPTTRIEKMRHQLKILLPLNICLIIFLYGLPLHSLLFDKNVSAFLIGWCIASGLLGVLFVISTPITLHNDLAIYENAIIPLRRPFRSTRNELIYIDDILKIEFEGMKDAETEIYEFEIYDKKNRLFRINSIVLARYDKNEKNAKKVHKLIMDLKKRIEKQIQPPGS